MQDLAKRAHNLVIGHCQSTNLPVASNPYAIITEDLHYMSNIGLEVLRRFQRFLLACVTIPDSLQEMCGRRTTFSRSRAQPSRVPRAPNQETEEVGEAKTIAIVIAARPIARRT